jgi:integrase
MASIQKRRRADGSVSYRVIIRQKDRPPRYATFDRRAEAVAWAEKTEAHADRNPIVAADGEGRTVNHMIGRYLDVVRLKKPHALQKQAQQLGWWCERLGNCSLARLTSARVAKEAAFLLGENIGSAARPRHRSPATVNRYLSALSKACKIAVTEWHWLHENPLRGLERKTERPGRTRCLSENEIAALLLACGESPMRELAVIVLLALTTGMRRGEILKLRWADIKLKQGMITIGDTAQRQSRVVPIAPQLLAALGQHAQTVGLSAELVFARSGDARLVDFDRAFVAAVRRAGLKDVRFHDLRRTTASYLAGAGRSPEEVAAVLGYKTLATVRRYKADGLSPSQAKQVRG